LHHETRTICQASYTNNNLLQRPQLWIFGNQGPENDSSLSMMFKKQKTKSPTKQRLWGNLEITFSSPQGLAHQSLINVINIWTHAWVTENNKFNSDYDYSCMLEVLTDLTCSQSKWRWPKQYEEKNLQVSHTFLTRISLWLQDVYNSNCIIGSK